MPLIMVKALVSANWYNESEGPKKTSIFFIVPNILLDDEESLVLALKLAKGKDFTINHFFPVEEGISCPNGSLELKEHLRCITVFSSLFIGTGNATKDIKIVFDEVAKRERLIRLLFNDDLLAGARIIT